MPMLDFRVETFLAVCRHMNFTKAARELNITQPAVSHHMHYLEQAYGTALFQHNGKRLQLTEAGEILRRTLMTMKHDEQHLQKRMQQVVSGTRDYSFGATLSVAEFMINEALGRFLRLHPDSHIQMQVADTKVLLSKLDSGELDFAVVEGDFPKAEYDFFVFGTEEYVAAGKIICIPSRCTIFLCNIIILKIIAIIYNCFLILNNCDISFVTIIDNTAIYCAYVITILDPSGSGGRVITSTYTSNPRSSRY